MRILLLAAVRFLLLLVVVALASGFSVAPSLSSSSQSPSLHHASALSSDTSSSTAAAATLFPVLHRIAGIEWTGPCRYVGADLKHVKDLKLFGGIRYDVTVPNKSSTNTAGDDTTSTSSDDDHDVVMCTLSSFLTFPNGKTREVVMTGAIPTAAQGSTSGDADAGTLRLNAVEGNGPIYMVLTELAPDTILINEVDKASGKVVLTSSLSLVSTRTTPGGGGGGLDELVQVSHEVGDDNSGAAASNNIIIEGHQVWRLKPTKHTTPPAQNNDDYDVRLGTTGR